MRRRIGIYNLAMRAMGGGEKQSLVVAEHLSRDHDVVVFVRDRVEPARLEAYFGVDLSRTRFVALDESPRRLDRLARRAGARAVQSAEALAHYRAVRRQGLDVFVNHTFLSDLPCPAPAGVYMCMFPVLATRYEPPSPLRRRLYRGLDLVERRLMGRPSAEGLDSYGVVVTLSDFTAGWTRRMWGRDSVLVHPPCDDQGPPAEKRPAILHVGRFFPITDGFYKRQDALLAAFRGMTPLHERGWELHLAGSVAPGAQRAVDALVEAARGLPVHFHFDTSREALRQLYREAAVYWHATGYGLPTSVHPANQEHFGITTVEAMSAGAVPVVLNTGGQREIVAHDADGFLWDTAEELASYTTRLATDPALRGRLGREAVRASRRFSRAAFTAGIDRAIERALEVERAA